MKQYFEDFEARLQVTEEKLDILSDWHIAKGHNGATEIAEDCRTAITSLWIEFHKLSETYKQAEASHEEFYQANVDNLIGGIKEYYNSQIAQYEKKPEFLLHNILNKIIKGENSNDEEFPTNSETWVYFRDLICKDLKERGILS